MPLPFLVHFVTQHRRAAGFQGTAAVMTCANGMVPSHSIEAHVAADQAVMWQMESQFFPSEFLMRQASELLRCPDGSSNGRPACPSGLTSFLERTWQSCEE
jgi:hypothetical protein